MEQVAFSVRTHGPSGIQEAKISINNIVLHHTDVRNPLESIPGGVVHAKNAFLTRSRDKMHHPGGNRHNTTVLHRTGPPKPMKSMFAVVVHEKYEFFLRPQLETRKIHGNPDGGPIT